MRSADLFVVYRLVNATSSLSVLDRFSLAIGGLKKLVFDTHPANGMSVPFIMMFTRWLNRLDARVQKLAAELRAGIIRPDPVSSPRPRGPRGPAKPRPPELRIPKRFAWLITRIPCKSAGHSALLHALMCDPEMIALAAASPRLERMLRPLCHMLAIRMGSFVAPPAVVPAEPPMPAPVPSYEDDWGSLGNFNSLDKHSPFAAFHGPAQAVAPKPHDPHPRDPHPDDQLGGEFFAPA